MVGDFFTDLHFASESVCVAPNRTTKESFHKTPMILWDSIRHQYGVFPAICLPSSPSPLPKVSIQTSPRKNYVKNLHPQGSQPEALASAAIGLGLKNPQQIVNVENTWRLTCNRYLLLPSLFQTKHSLQHRYKLLLGLGNAQNISPCRKPLQA